MRFKTLFLMTAALLMGLQASHALTLFNQSNLNYDPNFSPTMGGSQPSFVRATPFNIGNIGNHMAGGLTWYGGYVFGAAPAADDFTIAFFTNNAGQPANSAFATYHVGHVSRTALGTTVEVGGSPGGTADEFKYDVTIPDTLLLANTDYWIAIFNNTAVGQPQWAFRTTITGNSNRLTTNYTDPTPTWETSVHRPAIILTAVPEPSSLMLLGAVSLAGSMIRRRKLA